MTVGLEYVQTTPSRVPEVDNRTIADRQSIALETPQIPPKGEAATTPASTAPSVLPAELSRPLRVIGDYQLLEELGRGGMELSTSAETPGRQPHGRFEARSRKPTRNRPGATMLLLDRFHTEVKAASSLDDTHIATVYEVGEFDDDPYFTMCLVEGESLGKMTQAGSLPWELAANYLLPSCAPWPSCMRKESFIVI